MGGDGVSDNSAGATEKVGGMVNGASLALGGSTVAAETHVDNKLAKVRGVSEGERQGFGRKVLG